MISAHIEAVEASQEEIDEAFKYFSIPEERLVDKIQEKQRETVAKGSYCGMVKNQMIHTQILKGNREKINDLGLRKNVGRPPCKGNRKVIAPGKGEIKSINDWNALTNKETNRKNMRFLCARCVLSQKGKLGELRERFKKHLIQVHNFS